MEREQAKQILRNHGWLSLLPKAHRDKILASTVLKKFRKNEAIYALNDPAGGMYGLVRGSLAIVMAPDGGGPQLIHTALPGAWFGEGLLISGQPRRVGITARSDVATLYLPLPALKEFLKADPSFWRYIAMNSLLNADLALRAFHDAKLRNPDAKISSILLRLVGYQTPQFDPSSPSSADINQTELAEIAGLSRNVVNRVLARLSKARLITIGYGYIDLPNPARLISWLAEHEDK